MNSICICLTAMQLSANWKVAGLSLCEPPPRTLNGSLPVASYTPAGSQYCLGQKCFCFFGGVGCDSQSPHRAKGGRAKVLGVLQVGGATAKV